MKRAHNRMTRALNWMKREHNEIRNTHNQMKRALNQMKTPHNRIKRAYNQWNDHMKKCKGRTTKWKERMTEWKEHIKTIIERIWFAHKSVSVFHICWYFSCWYLFVSLWHCSRMSLSYLSSDYSLIFFCFSFCGP